MHAAIVYFQSLFIPSYFTVLYAFLGGIAYGVTGHKYGFTKVTIGLIVCSVVYVAYALGGVQMSATIISNQINPARSNLAKLWAAWQIISVVLLVGYSTVFFTSLGNTPQSRLIYLALALLLPVIACVAWAVAFTCYYQHRYFWAAMIFILGLILTLPTIATGGLQMAVNWGLFA